MILKRVQICNFKCIDDSNDFAIDQVTCLVGKNESGKSALLQSLYKLNPVTEADGNFEPLKDYPRSRWSEYKERSAAGPDVVLLTQWQLEQSDLDALAATLGPDALTDPLVHVTKDYANVVSWTVNIDEPSVVKHLVTEAGLWPEDGVDTRVIQGIPALIEKLESYETPSERQAALLRTLRELFPQQSVIDRAITILNARLPRLLYFANYQIMPATVAIDDLLAKISQGSVTVPERVFLALMSLVGIEPAQLGSIGRFEELIAELEAVSNRLSAVIFAYWSQNKHLEVQFRFDAGRSADPPPLNSGYIFRTRINDKRHGISLNFDERSSGFVWFFSFLIWFSQTQKNYGHNLIILLDEPGLTLHARAQADLLRFINERLAPQYQVIYTTHSPFMIDPSNLLRVRTVEDVVQGDETKGTKVGDQVLSTDADTLFPLQAALGYDITQTLFVGKHTLLVEGPSDLLYLKWFSHELQSAGRKHLDPRWTIAPVGGIPKIEGFVKLFAGNKLHLAVFVDYHEGEKAKIRSLRDSGLLGEHHVLSAEAYVKQSEADIEDLLGWSLYSTLVNTCYALSAPQQFPITSPHRTPARVLKEVESHFAVLPPTTPNFDHFSPASYLVENGTALRGSLPDLGHALDRFEKLFADLNGLLPAP